MRSCNIFSCVMSSGSASSEDEYSWKCSPSLWFIMDEGTLYGCHNAVLSTTYRPTIPLRGGSQSIIGQFLSSCVSFILLKMRKPREKLTRVSLAMGMLNFTIPGLCFCLFLLLFSLLFITFSQIKRKVLWFFKNKLQLFWQLTCSCQHSWLQARR